MDVEAAARLRRLAAQKNMAHAYLLEGSKGSGKGDFALSLAQGLLCAEPDSEGNPCGRCQVCAQLEAGSYPDLYRLGLEEGMIPAAEVRALREWLYQSPLSGSRKVAIIDEVSRLSPLSQNTLLKVLEEPPEQTTILITDSSGAAIDTIRSRAQRVWLGASDSKFATQSEWASLISNITELSVPKIFTAAEEISSLPQTEVRSLVEIWISEARDRLVDEAVRHDAERTIRRLLALYRTLSTNAAMRLQLEAALLELKLIAN